MDNKWLPYLLVFIVAIAQYTNTRDHDFAWDDAIVITENSRVQKGWSDIPKLFENIKTSKTENRYGYRPISLLSFATDVEFFGLDSKASHRISMVYYAVLCILILFFLQTIFPQHKGQNFLITLLFVVHPMHTEVVANIKSRDEVLAMGFGLLAMLCVFRALKNESLLSYLSFIAFLVLAFLSKENAVVFCGVAMLLLWYRLPSIGKIQRVRYVGVVISSFLLIIGIRLFVYSNLFFQNTDRDLFKKGLSLQDVFVGNPLISMQTEFFLKWLNTIQLGLFHIYKFIIPYPLVHDYGFNSLVLVSATSPWIYLAVFTAITLVLITLKALKNRTKLGFGVGFFFITASVYLHVVGVAPDIFGERFVFLSSLGLCIAVVDGSYGLFHKMNTKYWMFGFWIIIAVVFFAVSWNRNKAWKNNRTLLETDLPLLHNGARANYNYALLLHGLYYQLPEAEQATMPDSILKYYERVMEITDRLYPAYLDLGGAYMEFEKFDEAREVFQKAINRYPQISASYVQMGKYYMTFKEYEKATPYFENAIEKGSQGSDYYYYLAICQFNSKNYQQAIKVLYDGEQVGVSSVAYYTLMVNLHLRLGENEKGLQVLERGLNVFPNSEELENLKPSLSVK